jgi:hypothetical protein
MNNIDKKGLDVEAELTRILQEELDKYWEDAPIGYNKDNNGYHMGKGLIVNKETWDKYNKALKTRPELNPYEFMIELIKKESKNNEQP